MAAGVDPVVVRQLSGHKSERMTDLYTTPLDTRMRAAVEFCLNECNANESPAQRMSVGRCQP
jgi:hypothetical protein